MFKNRQRENLRAKLQGENFGGKSSVCFFHRIRDYRGLFKSRVMFPAPTETLDTKESQLIPWLNV